MSYQCLLVFFSCASYANEKYDCLEGVWQRSDGALMATYSKGVIKVSVFGSATGVYRVAEHERKHQLSLGEIKEKMPSAWANYNIDIKKNALVGAENEDLFNAVIASNSRSTIALICTNIQNQILFMEEGKAEESYEMLIRSSPASP